MIEVRGVPCAIYRGGTSRGVFFRENDLPFPRALTAQVLIDIMGSPHPRQVNGLGGGASITSKIMIVGPSRTPEADVQMTFGQVSVNAALVDWGGICGNLTTAVGPFAIDQGLVPAVEPFTDLRVYSVNSRKVIKLRVPVYRGRAVWEGDYTIAGVPGTGARIELEFTEPAGGICGNLLPTGRPRDRLKLRDGRSFDVSIVDAGNLVVFCRPRELGLRGDELPAELEVNAEATMTLEAIRSLVAEMLGIVPSRNVATAKSPGLPKVGFVAPPHAYETITGRALAADEIDLIGRLMTMQTPHHAYMGGGAICTGAAAMIEDTVVAEACRAEARQNRRIRIGHPSGVMDVAVKTAPGESGLTRIQSVTIARTARRIMEGTAYVSGSYFSDAG